MLLGQLVDFSFRHRVYGEREALREMDGGQWGG